MIILYLKWDQTTDVYHGFFFLKDSTKRWQLLVTLLVKSLSASMVYVRVAMLFYVLAYRVHASILPFPIRNTVVLVLYSKYSPGCKIHLNLPLWFIYSGSYLVLY